MLKFVHDDRQTNFSPNTTRIGVRFAHKYNNLLCKTVDILSVVLSPQIVSSYETGLPHTLDPHTLDTLGLDDFNGTLKLKAFGAHFRIDMKNKVPQ